MNSEWSMQAQDLQHWRKVVAGRAGFNGHPQALLKLLAVSDNRELGRLAEAYPVAVRAFREDRGDIEPCPHEHPETGEPCIWLAGHGEWLERPLMGDRRPGRLVMHSWGEPREPGEWRGEPARVL